MCSSDHLCASKDGEWCVCLRIGELNRMDITQLHKALMRLGREQTQMLTNKHFGDMNTDDKDLHARILAKA